MINEAAAKAFFAARSPIGETIGLGTSNVYQVIGIVRDQKHMSVREPTPRFAYVPLWQRVDGISRITLAASFDRSQANLAHQITQEVRGIHANTLVSDVIAVSEQIDATLISERLLSVLASGFAVLALVLAAIGLYGILSYSVARRRVEFGVRMALGATPGLVMRGLFTETLVPLAIGIGIGLPAALAAAHAARRLVFEVSPVNPGIYLISTAVLAAVAGLAVWLPARRAAKVHPMVALRYE
jgi:ABC-type antimicrobial peptide transport system permease subunit